MQYQQLLTTTVIFAAGKNYQRMLKLIYESMIKKQVNCIGSRSSPKYLLIINRKSYGEACPDQFHQVINVDLIDNKKYQYNRLVDAVP